MGTLNVTAVTRLAQEGGQRQPIPHYGNSKNLSTTTGPSARTAIPTNVDGSKPKYLRVVADEAMYIKIGPEANLAAAAGDFLLTANEPEFLEIKSDTTHIAAIDVS